MEMYECLCMYVARLLKVLSLSEKFLIKSIHLDTFILSEINPPHIHLYVCV